MVSHPIKLWSMLWCHGIVTIFVQENNFFSQILAKLSKKLRIGQTAEYGRFRRDLGCGKAVKSRGRGAKIIWGRLGGGQGAVVARNYKQMAISL